MSSHKKQHEETLDVVTCLNGVLANEYALFTKTLNYHWNITGPRFHSLHKFLEGQYRELLEVMDEVAERVRILDERPISTIKGMYSHMEIKDGQEKAPNAETMLQNLMEDHETIQKRLKEIVTDKSKRETDPGTEDMFISLLRKHETMSWMLRSHIVKDGK
jgi:starvation-inducible DNA-binding protein